jgi:hypothetical protein
MRRGGLPFIVVMLTACSSRSTPEDTSDASLDVARTDTPGDAARLDGNAGDAGPAAACPATASSDSCPVEGQTCQYGCTGCLCESGFWYCSAPGCAGGCQGDVGSPPAEGEACGGCCGPSVGDTCTFSCVGEDAGKATETCESSGWHVTVPCRGAAADGGRDAQTDGD